MSNKNGQDSHSNQQSLGDTRLTVFSAYTLFLSVLIILVGLSIGMSMTFVGRVSDIEKHVESIESSKATNDEWIKKSLEEIKTDIKEIRDKSRKLWGN